MADRKVDQMEKRFFAAMENKSVDRIMEERLLYYRFGKRGLCGSFSWNIDPQFNLEFSGA